MKNLYYSMGVTFLLINILYTLVLPYTTVFKVTSNDDAENRLFWQINIHIFFGLRQILTFTWLMQWLVFLHKVIPKEATLISPPYTKASSEEFLSSQFEEDESTRFKTPEKNSDWKNRGSTPASIQYEEDFYGQSLRHNADRFRQSDSSMPNSFALMRSGKKRDSSTTDDLACERAPLTTAQNFLQQNMTDAESSSIGTSASETSQY